LSGNIPAFSGKTSPDQQKKPFFSFFCRPGPVLTLNPIDKNQ